MPTAILADDEAMLLTDLAQRLQQLWPELHIIATATNGLAAAELIKQQPDIAFLDIRMPGLNGLAVAATAQQSRVVFVTAYDEYAVQAFEHAAVDYLLKPVSDARLQQCVQRLKHQQAPAATLYQQLLQQLQAPPRYLQWFTVGLANKTRLIASHEVLYIRANEKYTELVTRQECHIIRTPLKELISQLDPNQFRQVHRSYIVQLAQVACIEKDLFGRFQMKLRDCHDELPLSRTFASAFRQM